MSAFLVRRDMVWLFLHQAATGDQRDAAAGRGTAVARAASGCGRCMRSPCRSRSCWAWITIYGMGSMLVAGITTTCCCRRDDVDRRHVLARARTACRAARRAVLAWAFILWGLHHLDYPLLRGFGAARAATACSPTCCSCSPSALGLLFLVLGRRTRSLAARTAELEQLTRLMLRVQEDERRRIARELHDEAGQVLTAVKIELDLEGRARGRRAGGARALAGARPEQPAAARRRSTISVWSPRCARWPRTSRPHPHCRWTSTIEGASRRFAVRTSRW